MIRVAVYFPETQRRIGGGDWIQMLRTVESINRLGIAKAQLLHDLPDDLHGYDLVHVCNLLRPVDLLEPVLAAAKARRPLVLSSIYWDDATYRLRGRWNQPSPSEPLGRMALEAEQLGLQADIALRQAVLNCIDALITLSKTESEVISQQLRPPADLIVGVAYNGVDPVFFSGQSRHFTERYKVDAFILTVGRIEDRKNQLNLIRAVKGLDLPLVVVGSPLDQLPYYRQCLAEGEGHVIFVPHMSAEELADAYAAAQVFALPSWMDPAPLACLEAAAGGCRVVTSAYGATGEYLQGQCWICDPASVQSIRETILEALRCPLDRSAISDTVRRFTWQDTAKQVASIYEQVLARGYRAKPVDELWVRAVREISELADLRSRLASVVSNHTQRVASMLERQGLWHRLANRTKLQARDLRGTIKLVGLPAKVLAGQRIEVRLAATNLGTEIWPDAVHDPWPVNIGLRWWAGSRLVGEGRCFLPAPLRPQETAEWQDVIVAPAEPGHYQLEVGLVHEGHAWSHQVGGPRLIFDAEVV